MLLLLLQLISFNVFGEELESLHKPAQLDKPTPLHSPQNSTLHHHHNRNLSRPLLTLLYTLPTMLNLQPITTTTTLLLMPLFNLQPIITIATLLPVPLFINNTLLLMHLFNIQLVTTIVTTLLLTPLFPNLLQFILHSMFLYLLNPE